MYVSESRTGRDFDIHVAHHHQELPGEISAFFALTRFPTTRVYSSLVPTRIRSGPHFIGIGCHLSRSSAEIRRAVRDAYTLPTRPPENSE